MVDRPLAVASAARLRLPLRDPRMSGFADGVEPLDGLRTEEP